MRPGVPVFWEVRQPDIGQWHFHVKLTMRICKEKNICVSVIGRSGIAYLCSSGYKSSSVRPKCSAMSSGMSPRPLL